jgi:hypothetical protein
MRGDNVNRRLFVLLVAVGVTLTAVGCRVPATKGPRAMSMDRKVALGRAESTQVSVAIGFGDLTVSGGAEGALDAHFQYDVPEWKPEVTYEVTNGLGRLDVQQPSSDASERTKGTHYSWDMRHPSKVRVQARDVSYNWDLKLPSKVPTDLTIEMGAGNVRLDTRSMKLRRLKVAAGAGEGNIDLSSVTGDLTAKIEAGVGKLVLQVPADVGVIVKADGIGSINAPEMTRGDEGWTNAAWGKSKTSIRVDVAGIGDVEIKTVPKQSI